MANVLPNPPDKITTSFIVMNLFFYNFAGHPATTQYEGTSLFTTAPAATTLHSPIVTPGKITAPAPTQTLSSIFIGFAYLDIKYPTYYMEY